MGNVVHALDEAAREKIRAMSGQVFESITPEEQARWKKQLDSISADWVKQTLNGQAILAAFREEVKRARAEK